MRASFLILAGLLLLVPGGADAVKRVVAVHGSDGAGCGTKLAPCRSIGAALAQALPGDTVEVGPGRYGDLDGDGAFDPGEEAPQVDSGCDCLVHVNAPVRVISREGAGATVIDAGGLPVNVVRVDADGAAFGAPQHGFTLTGSGDGEGLRVGGEGVRVEANLSVGNDQGFQINGDRFFFAGNRMVGNAGIGVDFEAEDGVARGNSAIRNGGGGFEIETRDRVEGNFAALNDNDDTSFELQGSDNVVRGNAALGGSIGFDLGTRSLLEGNAANANQRGIVIDSLENVVRGNQVVGNHASGVLVEAGGSGEIRGNSLYGNGSTDLGEGLNCGVAHLDPLVPPLVGNFWGAAAGPGADPADDVCSVVPPLEPLLLLPVASVEIRPKVKAAQQLAKLAKALAPATPAPAPRLFVSHLGSDAAGCGTQASPCRTIAAALAQAAPGDTIDVGPGRYGDANADGDFDDPGDEPAEIGSGCECAIHVEAGVTLRSRDGAGATLLFGGFAVTDVVLVTGNGATFGGPKHGFTVTGAVGASADGVDVAADGVRIEGNLLVGNEVSGLRLFGAGGFVVGNQASTNGSSGFDLEDATGAVVAANTAIANFNGFELGAGNRAAGNLAAANEADGFSLEGSGVSLRASAAVRNGTGVRLAGTDGLLEASLLAGNQRGLDVHGTGAVVRANGIVGNSGAGVFVDDGAAVALGGNSIAGNHAGTDPLLPPAGNCGVAFGATSTPSFPGNFWGAPGGPGPDPADAFCSLVPTPAPSFDPVVPSEIRVKVKAAR